MHEWHHTVKLNVHTEFDDDEDWDNWTGSYEVDEGPHCDDPNFNVIQQMLHTSCICDNVTTSVVDNIDFKHKYNT